MNINDFPLEILLTIVDLLDFNERKNCRLVCQHWNDVIVGNKKSFDPKWTIQLQNYMFPSVEEILETDVKWQKMIIGANQSCLFSSDLEIPWEKVVGDIEELDIDQGNTQLVRKIGSKFKNLIKMKSESSRDLLNILKTTRLGETLQTIEMTSISCFRFLNDIIEHCPDLRLLVCEIPRMRTRKEEMCEIIKKHEKIQFLFTECTDMLAALLVGAPIADDDQEATHLTCTDLRHKLKSLEPDVDAIVISETKTQYIDRPVVKENVKNLTLGYFFNFKRIDCFTNLLQCFPNLCTLNVLNGHYLDQRLFKAIQNQLPHLAEFSVYKFKKEISLLTDLGGENVVKMQVGAQSRVRRDDLVKLKKAFPNLVYLKLKGDFEDSLRNVLETVLECFPKLVKLYISDVDIGKGRKSIRDVDIYQVLKKWGKNLELLNVQQKLKDKDTEMLAKIFKNNPKLRVCNEVFCANTLLE